MSYFKPVYNSVSEHDFISLALAHDAMDKHVPAVDTSMHGTRFCANCLMPLLYGKVEAPRGNKRPRNYRFVDDIEEINQPEYMLRVLACYMQVRSFTMVDGILRNTNWKPEYRPILLKYFMPQHRSVSRQYARVAQWVAKYDAPTDELRQYASLDPETAYDYAVNADRAPHIVTRAAACRSAVTAVDYAKYVDKCYIPSTLAASLHNKSTAFDYLRASCPTWRPGSPQT